MNQTTRSQNEGNVDELPMQFNQHNSLTGQSQSLLPRQVPYLPPHSFHPRNDQFTNVRNSIFSHHNVTTRSPFADIANATTDTRLLQPSQYHSLRGQNQRFSLNQATHPPPYTHQPRTNVNAQSVAKDNNSFSLHQNVAAQSHLAQSTENNTMQASGLKRGKETGKMTTNRIIRSVLYSFFAEGQNLPLKTLCKSFGLTHKYETIKRRIKGNLKLCQIQESQPNRKEGFTKSDFCEACKIVMIMLDSRDAPYVGQNFCIGLDTEHCHQLYKIDVATFSQNYEHSLGHYRAKRCLIHMPSSVSKAENEKWVRRKKSQRWQCPNCVTARKSICARKNIASKIVKLKYKSVIALPEDLKGQIKRINQGLVDSGCSLVERHQKLKEDDELIDCLDLLHQKYNDAEVRCDDGTSILRCKAWCKGRVLCNNIIIASGRQYEARLTNSMCECCRNVAKNEVRSERIRNINFTQQVAAGSRTRYDALTSPQRIQRRKNERHAKANFKRSNENLKRKLELCKSFIDPAAADYRAKAEKELGEKITVDMDAAERKRDNFMAASKFTMETILEEKAEFLPLLEGMLYEMLDRGVAMEEKKNNYEFKREDVKEIVEQIMEQMSNEVKVLSGKATATSFSPKTYQISHALFSRSPAHYREFKALSAFHYPSISGHKKIKTANKVSAGRGTKAYEMFLSGKIHKSEQDVPYFGYVMYDELKVHEGVVWGTFDGISVGLASDMLDLRTVLHRLLSKDGDTVEKAKYVNQWMYIKLNASKHEKVMAGFWFNDGSITGDTIFNQFLNVLTSLESIGCRVLGIVSDAGGPNASFVLRLRSMKNFDKEIWLNEDECYVLNPYEPSRRIYFYFCVTHLLKSMRGQLHASQQGKSKAFKDEDGTPFGWGVLVDLYNNMQSREDVEINADTCPVDEKVIHPDKQVSMNVSIALKASADNTLAALKMQVQKHELLNTNERAIREATVQEKSKLPFIRTKSEADHHPHIRHGWHAVEIRHLKDLAKRRNEVLFALNDVIETINIKSKGLTAAEVEGMRDDIFFACQPDDNQAPVAVQQTLSDCTYLHQLVKPILLDGISDLVVERPSNPVEWLAVYCAEHKARNQSVSSSRCDASIAPSPYLPIRDYINKMLVSTLLRGMSELAMKRPSNPTEWLGKYCRESIPSAATEKVAKELAVTLPYQSAVPISSHDLGSLSNICAKSAMVDLCVKPAVMNQYSKSAVVNPYKPYVKSAVANPYAKQAAAKSDSNKQPLEPRTLKSTRLPLDDTTKQNASMHAPKPSSTNDQCQPDQLSSEPRGSNLEDNGQSLSDGEIEDGAPDENKTYKIESTDMNYDVPGQLQSELDEILKEVTLKRNKLNVPPNKIHSDLSSIEYLAVVNGLFNELLMKKQESFTSGNLEAYKKFLQDEMDYFDKWRQAQLRRRENGDPNWERSCMDRVTYRNLRIALCGFYYFAKYLLEMLPGRIDGFDYVPMQLNNSTPLEGKFSCERAMGQVTAQSHESNISNSCQRMTNSALANPAASYRAEDDIEEKETYVSTSRSNVFTKYGKELTEKLTKLVASLPAEDNAGDARISRFGDEVAIHKAQLTEVLATKMNESPIEYSSFRRELLNHESFQNWFRLSAHNSSRNKWFEEFAKGGDDEIDAICQGVLRKIFSIMKDVVYCSTISFERGFFDYLLGEGFKELIEQRLPQKLRGSRPCAIYLVETLKCMFERWYYDALSDLIPNKLRCDDVDVDDILDKETLLVHVHNIVGAVIPDLKKKWSRHEKACDLVHSMAFRTFKDEIDTDYYDEYVPEYVRHRNKGGVSLVSKRFIHWAMDLMKLCMNRNTDQSMNQQRSGYIKGGFDELKNKEGPLYSKFRAIALTFDITLNDSNIYEIYERTALFTMRTYSKFRNNKRFNKEKSSRDDMGNIKFRTLVQTGSKVTKKKKSKEKKKPFSVMMANMNALNGVAAQPAAINKARPKSDDEIKQEYQHDLQTTLIKLRDNKCNTARLNKMECCTLLWLSFKDYYRHTSKLLKADDIRKKLDGAIAANPSWMGRQEGNKLVAGENTAPPRDDDEGNAAAGNEGDSSSLGDSEGECNDCVRVCDTAALARGGTAKIDRGANGVDNDNSVDEEQEQGQGDGENAATATVMKHVVATIVA